MDTNTKKRIVAAAIATLMGRPIEIITVTATGGDDWFIVHYIRDGGDRFYYATRIVGDRVVWRTRVGGVLGRMRDDPRDEVLAFQIGEGVVTVTASQNGIPFNLRSYPL